MSDKSDGPAKPLKEIAAVLAGQDRTLSNIEEDVVLLQKKDVEQRVRN